MIQRVSLEARLVDTHVFPSLLGDFFASIGGDTFQASDEFFARDGNFRTSQLNRSVTRCFARQRGDFQRLASRSHGVDTSIDIQRELCDFDEIFDDVAFGMCFLLWLRLLQLCVDDNSLFLLLDFIRT